MTVQGYDHVGGPFKFPPTELRSSHDEHDIMKAQGQKRAEQHNCVCLNHTQSSKSSLCRLLGNEGEQALTKKVKVRQMKTREFARGIPAQDLLRSL